VTPPTREPLTFQICVASTERLDRFLADQLSISRTQAARMLTDGAVWVNQKVARASQTMVRGDHISVRTEEGREAPRHLVPHPISLTVVYEDDFLLVIDKPAGLVVHPAPGHWDDTLVNALAARGLTTLAEVAVEGEDEASMLPLAASPASRLRPGIVHRLDKDTSGLIIVAKTDEAHRKLSHALGLRRIERVYAALVWGHIKAEQEIIEPIARDLHDRRRMAVVKTGRPARTLITPIARYATCDLIRARLFTGRTHQIRVHLNHIGHPVVGDSVYGGGGHRRMTGEQQTLARRVERDTPRQALHAAILRFAHPDSREWLEFHSDWPADLRASLAMVAGDSTLLARPNLLEYLGFRA
jgi:23S rRNA pseudouridine1911/1915/1917 synthase